jgi:hypothetical protein
LEAAGAKLGGWLSLSGGAGVPPAGELVAEALGLVQRIDTWRVEAAREPAGR